MIRIAMQYEKPSGAMHDVIRHALDELHAQNNPYGCITLITNALRNSSHLPVLRSGRDYVDASTNNATDTPLNSSLELSIHGLAAFHLPVSSSLMEGGACLGVHPTAVLSSSSAAVGIDGQRYHVGDKTPVMGNRVSVSRISDVSSAGGGGNTDGYNNYNNKRLSNNNDEDGHDLNSSVVTTAGRSFLMPSVATPMRGGAGAVKLGVSSSNNNTSNYMDAMTRKSNSNSIGGPLTFNRTQLLRLLLIRVDAFVATRQYEKALHDALCAVEMSYEQSADAYFVLGREQHRLLHMTEAVAAFDRAETVLAAKLRACRAGEGRMGGCSSNSVGVEEPLSDAEFWAQRGFHPGEEEYLLETVRPNKELAAMRQPPVQRAEFELHETEAMRQGSGSSVANILAAVLRARASSSGAALADAPTARTPLSTIARAVDASSQNQANVASANTFVGTTTASPTSFSGNVASQNCAVQESGPVLPTMFSSNNLSHPSLAMANNHGSNTKSHSDEIEDVDLYKDELARFGISLAELGVWRRLARASRLLLALRSCHTVPNDVLPAIMSVLQRTVSSVRGGLIVSIENSTGYDLRLLGCTAPDASYHADYSFPEFIPRRHCGLAVLQPRSWRSFSGAACYAITQTLCCFFYFESPLINAIRFGVRFSEQEDNEVLRQAYEELRVGGSSGRNGTVYVCGAAGGIVGGTTTQGNSNNNSITHTVSAGSTAVCPWAVASDTPHSVSSMAPLSPAPVESEPDRMLDAFHASIHSDNPNAMTSATLSADGVTGRGGAVAGGMGSNSGNTIGNMCTNTPLHESSVWGVAGTEGDNKSTEMPHYSSAGMPAAVSNSTAPFHLGSAAGTGAHPGRTSIPFHKADPIVSANAACATPSNNIHSSSISNFLTIHSNWMSGSNNTSFSAAAMGAAQRAIKMPNPSLWLNAHTASFDHHNVVVRVSGQTVGAQSIGFTLNQAPPVRLRSVELLHALEFAGVHTLKKMSQVSRHYRALVNHLPPAMFYAPLRRSYPDYCVGEDLLQSPWTVRDREVVTWRVVFDHRHAERDEYLVQDDLMDSNYNNNNNNNNISLHSLGSNNANCYAPSGPLSSPPQQQQFQSQQQPSQQSTALSQSHSTILHYVTDAQAKIAGILYYGDKRCALLQFKESWVPFSKTVYIATMQGRTFASFTAGVQGQFKMSVETSVAVGVSGSALVGGGVVSSTSTGGSASVHASASGKETVLYTMVRRKSWERSPITANAQVKRGVWEYGKDDEATTASATGELEVDGNGSTRQSVTGGMDAVGRAVDSISAATAIRRHADAMRRTSSPCKERNATTTMSSLAAGSSMDSGNARQRQVCYTVWRSHRTSSTIIPGGGDVPATPGHGADIMGEIRLTPSVRAAHVALRSTVAEVALLPGADALLLVVMTLCIARWE